MIFNFVVDRDYENFQIYGTHIATIANSDILYKLLYSILQLSVHQSVNMEHAQAPIIALVQLGIKVIAVKKVRS